MRFGEAYVSCTFSIGRQFCYGGTGEEYRFESLVGLKQDGS